MWQRLAFKLTYSAIPWELVKYFYMAGTTLNLTAVRYAVGRVASFSIIFVEKWQSLRFEIMIHDPALAI